MLSYRKVAHAYGARPVLDDVTFSIERGECVALVGTSGSGKTTLFRLAYGAFAPTAGSVLVGGSDLAHQSTSALRATRARIAVIFQAHGLVDQLSVGANVIAGTFGRRSTLGALRSVLAPAAVDRAAIVAALTHVGLADRIDDRAFELSGGQRQRVAIARAIVQRAELVLADEPVAALDPQLALEIVDLLVRDARDRNAALLCTLHQPELTRAFDRVITLAGGCIIADRRTAAA
jgi:phosphonate transport system ATP-binding protein